MNLTIVGTGYVGLVTGACFAEFGYSVTCVDKDIKRLEMLKSGKCPFFEPGMDDLLDKHINKTNLISFESNIKDNLDNTDVIFITVGTPTRRLEDEADLSFVWQVAEEIADNIKKYCLVVTKSTVPVGTTREVKKIISNKIDQKLFDVVSNPEFLREGSAINDFIRPDRIVIGTENKKSENIMRELYRPLFLKETPIVATSIETSEIIKYASNSLDAIFIEVESLTSSVLGLKLKPRKQIVDLSSMFENNLSEIFIMRSLLDLLTALIIDRSIFLFLAVEAKALTSFGKHEPPNPGPAFKNLDPILLSIPIA